MKVVHHFIIDIEVEGLHRKEELEDAIRKAVSGCGGKVVDVDHGEEDEYQLRQRNKEEIHDFLEAMRDHFDYGGDTD